MKPTDKITLTFGQLKRLIKESYVYTPPKPSRERAKDLLWRVEEELSKGCPGNGLEILTRYGEEISMFYPYDVARLTKKCKYELNEPSLTERKKKKKKKIRQARWFPPRIMPFPPKPPKGGPGPVPPPPGPGPNPPPPGPPPPGPGPAM
jgi:hypothetical protein